MVPKMFEALKFDCICMYTLPYLACWVKRPPKTAKNKEKLKGFDTKGMWKIFFLWHYFLGKKKNHQFVACWVLKFKCAIAPDKCVRGRGGEGVQETICLFLHKNMWILIRSAWIKHFQWVHTTRSCGEISKIQAILGWKKHLKCSYALPYLNVRLTLVLLNKLRCLATSNFQPQITWSGLLI